jgi:hypothetical protein
VPYGAPEAYNPAYNAQQLDQLLAPIALYPDGLLSQILVAATYPEQVMQAAQWSRANPGLEGDAAVQAAQGMGWDPSVASLTAFPQVLMQMEQNFDWVRALGQAFFTQEPMVMDAVQDLRRRAQAAGTLRSDEQLRIEQNGPMLMIEPAQPQVTYVPYYDPLVAYGPWPWVAYPPVYWAPWAGYRWRPGIRAGFAWGPGVRHSAPFNYGRIDWGQRRLHIPDRRGAWIPYQRRADFPRPSVQLNAVPFDARRDGRGDGRRDANRDGRRVDSPRIDTPRIDAPRFEGRRGADATPRTQPPVAPVRPAPSTVPTPTAPAPTARPAPTADSRHDPSRWQQRREERRLEAGPRAAPSVPSAAMPAAQPRTAPAAPTAPTVGAPSSQPRDHGQGRGNRGHHGGEQRGEPRGEGRGKT